MSFRPFRTQYLGYWLLGLLLLAAGTLDLATPLMTVLFSFFILRALSFGRRKWIPTVIFLLLVLGFLYGSGFFLKQAVVALPRIIEDSLPKVTEFAREKGFKLPFTDAPELDALGHDDAHAPDRNAAGDENAAAPGGIDGGKGPVVTKDGVDPNETEEQREFRELKARSVTWLKSELRYVGNFARIATKEFAFLLIGLVVAISLFFNSQIDLNRGQYALRNNLYSFACDEIALRFRSFYASFARVMGAQLMISTINTGFTAVYVLVVGLHYAAVVIVLTFVCGMLPIIGNLISNTVIVALSFAVSPQLAMASLIFLIVLHKLEYLLNSKIIGERIKNPVWLTLLALVIGERLMGIPGMILAPVLLDFIKNEASTIEMTRSEYLPDRVEGEIRRDEPPKASAA